MIENKQILITGGGGFIGSHLTDALVKQNDVTVIDDLSTGSQEVIHDDAELHHVDITNYDRLNKKINDPDIVFHLAADARTKTTSAGWDNPHHDIHVNAIGTLNLLETIRKSQVEPKVVYSSSCAIYGEPEYVPIDEEHPLNPISPYGVHKLAGDRYMLAYASEHGMDTSSIRIFNAYGSRQPRHVMYDFLKKLQEDNNTLEVLGTGEQVRDYTYIDDAISAFETVALHGKAGEAYNLSGEGIISVGELAELIIEILELDTTITYTGESWKGDPDILKADVTKLKAIGYEPSVDIREGLQRFIEYFQRTEGSIQA